MSWRSKVKYMCLWGPFHTHTVAVAVDKYRRATVMSVAVIHSHRFALLQLIFTDVLVAFLFLSQNNVRAEEFIMVHSWMIECIMLGKKSMP